MRLAKRPDTAKGRATARAASAIVDEAMESDVSPYHQIVEAAPDAMVVVDGSGRMVMVNAQAEEMFGYGRDEMIGQPIEMLMPDRYREAHAGHRENYIARPQVRPMGSGLELAGRRRDGSEFPVEVSLSPIRTDAGMLVTSAIRDVTERRRVEAELQRQAKALHERSEQLSVSIREAHHRIKNNLQAVSDLLYLEMTEGDESSMKEALKESIERIQAIALVHDFLSKDADVRVVDVSSVLSQLVPMVLRSNVPVPDAIEIELDLAHLVLPSKKATALALIVNELVTNAAKHGLSSRSQGKLRVSLGPEEEDLVLRVQDDGVGFPAEFDPRRTRRVGLMVAQTLAERDLDGRIVFGPDADTGATSATGRAGSREPGAGSRERGGARVEIRFPW
jgi:PAS domain S-box-containing protein